MNRHNEVRSKGWDFGSPCVTADSVMVHDWYPEEEPSRMEFKSTDYGFWAPGTNASSVIMDSSDGNGRNAAGDFIVPRGVDQVKVISTPVGSVTAPFAFTPYHGQVTWNVHKAPFFGGPGWHITPSHFDESCPLPPASAVTPFAVKAFEEMELQFPAKIDIVAFLAELKNIPGLIDHAANILDVLKQKGRNIHKRMAQIHVGEEFGVAPLLGDMAGIYNTLNNVKKRLEWLRKNKGKWVRVGSASTYSREENTHLGQLGITGYMPALEARLVHSTWKLTCSARVKPNMPWLGGWESWVRGVLSHGGMNRPFSTFWELTPFSWAVDYFLPVGDYLRTIVFQDNSNWETRNACWSSKGTHTIELSVAGELYGLPYKKKVGRYQLVRYRRQLGWPPFEWFFGEPSDKQLSLLAAVASQH